MDDFTENKDYGIERSQPDAATQDTSLVIVNNRVVLPKTRAVALESKKFHALLRRTVPSVAPELVEALKAKRERPSRLSRLGLFVGLAALFAVVLLLWPRNTPLLDTTLTYEIATLTSDKVDDNYRNLLRDCVGLMNQDEYTACAAKLKEPVEDIMKNAALFHANGRLLSMYLGCKKKSLDYTKGATCANLLPLCRKAQEYSDSPEWKIYELLFLWAPLKPTCDGLREGNLNALKKKQRRTELGTGLAMVDTHGYKVNGTLAQRSDAQKFQKTLDKIRCEILIARWLVDGYPGYPDDKDNKGVSFREEAYGIAKTYKDDIAFLKMRREIANRILNGDHTIFNYYYFDGHKYYGAEHLTDAIKEIDKGIEEWHKKQEGKR